MRARIAALLCITLLSGCTEAPVKSEAQSFRIDKTVNETRDSLIEYFTFNNYRVDENNSHYIKAFEYSRGTGMYGDHGDFVHVWLNTAGDNQTLVQVDVTSKGYIWDSERDAYVIKQIKRYLNTP